MIFYIDAYKQQCGARGHLPRSFTDRSWFHHFPRLPESQDTLRIPSARALSDSLLVPEIQRVHAENFSVYGIGKCGTR